MAQSNPVKVICVKKNEDGVDCYYPMDLTNDYIPVVAIPVTQLSTTMMKARGYCFATGKANTIITSGNLPLVIDPKNITSDITYNNGILTLPNSKFYDIDCRISLLLTTGTIKFDIIGTNLSLNAYVSDPDTIKGVVTIKGLIKTSDTLPSTMSINVTAAGGTFTLGSSSVVKIVEC